jgi:hypothetical protein
MKKFILMSVIYSTLVLPILAARERNAVRGAKKAVALFVAYNILYAFLVLVVWANLED